MKKRITVLSNDQTTPRFVLSLEGEVISDVTISPKRIRFGELGKSEKASKEFWVALRNPDKVKIESVTIEDKKFTVSHKGDDPKKGAHYEIKFSGSPSFGRISTKVRIAVNGLNKPPKSVPVTANIAGNLRYTKRLFFYKKPEGFSPSKVIVSAKNGAPVTIKKVDDPDGLLNLKVQKNNSPSVFIQAEVANPDMEFDKRLIHKLIVQTSDKDEPTIALSYTIADTSSTRFQRNALRTKKNRGQGRKEKRPTNQKEVLK